MMLDVKAEPLSVMLVFDFVGELSQYLHEGVHYRICVWFADRDSEQITREAIARRQDVRVTI